MSPNDPSPIRGPASDAAQTLRELATAALGGGRGAFEQIHRRLSGGLLRFLMKRLGGQVDLAEELAQRTWTAVWGSLRDRKYDPERAALTTFVYAVGNKMVLQHARTLRGPMGGSEALQREALRLSEDEPHPADAMGLAELLDAMRECLHARGTPDCLTDDERRIVIGVAGGESDRSMAAKMGVAASTVNGRKQAAYAKLRRNLAARGFTPEQTERLVPGGE